ncbi:MAG: P-II family nitrogen regulator [Desulfitobacteriaceae bacterium]|nr:P-II family nitrogen regulator [Desulfitobacteriaceae bacterium]MDI6880559.1 P-II family nitrogen regulator [Desulfitobacteriaceae bacterium]MDI6915012.1 P-II family nitrogen regulator [Desulfitobacteriaceae bacterium]
MKKIEAIVRPGKLETIKEALSKLGIRGLTVSNILGCGNQKGYTEIYRGQEVKIQLLPKIRLEIVLPDELAEEAIDAIIEAARTGNVGDGKIFIYDVQEAIRIRTGDKGLSAL